VFGGTFNPIHLGHLLVADDVRERLALDRMLFVPAAVPPHKPPDDLAPALDRFEMTRLAVAAHPLFAVSDVELSRPGPSYTVDTLRLLGAAGDELHLLIGSETFLDLLHWRAPREVASLARLVVVPRTGDGFDPDSPAAQRVLRELGLPPFCHGASAEPRAPVLLRAASLPISGSDLRRRAQEGRSLAYRMPDAVIAHIRERGLYRALAAPTAATSSGAGPSSR
jgi:nicotinate-nucleotide adenylyltransferase